MTLITTLIPAYKKDYLAELFLGLRHQTCKDFKVILSDDSPDDEITRLIRDGHYAALLSKLDLTVVRGPKNARKNHQQLLDLWGGKTPLVHFNLDDDLIYPDFYRMHAAAHALGGYAATVSRRWLSGSDGRPSIDLPIPDFIAEPNQRIVDIDTAGLFGSTVAVCENWLGELSNMVLSVDGARHYPQPPADGVSYYGLLDIGLLLDASRHLPIAFIHDHLSVFRQNPQQTTHNVKSHGGRVAFLCWVTYALAAWKEQRISAAQAVQAVGIATRRIIAHYADDEIMAGYLDLLEKNSSGLEQLHAAFAPFWTRLLASNIGTRPSTAQPDSAAAGSAREALAV
jgi:hypothetical protein